MKIYSSPYKDSVYSSDPGVIKEANIVVKLWDTDGGKDRPIDISVRFGESTIKVFAVNRKTQKPYKATLKFDKSYGQN